MVLLWYPPCSTCQKAKAFLDKLGVAYALRPIREENPTREELAAWADRSGLPLERFFNTSGQVYRSLGLKDRLPGLSREEKLALLAGDGMLVKRPLLVGEDFVLVGFREDQWARQLAPLAGDGKDGIGR